MSRAIDAYVGTWIAAPWNVTAHPRRDAIRWHSTRTGDYAFCPACGLSFRSFAEQDEHADACERLAQLVTVALDIASPGNGHPFSPPVPPVHTPVLPSSYMEIK